MVLSLSRGGNKMSENMKALIVELLTPILGYKIENYDDNIILLMNRKNVPLINLLYFFDEMERKLLLPVSKILENRFYTVMTVNNLAKAIADDFS